MGFFRIIQKLNKVMAETQAYKKYKEVAHLHSEGENFWATIEYDFAIHLQVGDKIYLRYDDEDGWSPFIRSVEESDITSLPTEFEVVGRLFTAYCLLIDIEEVKE